MVHFTRLKLAVSSAQFHQKTSSALSSTKI
jgi:hypothetical protein